MRHVNIFTFTIIIIIIIDIKQSCSILYIIAYNGLIHQRILRE